MTKNLRERESQRGGEGWRKGERGDTQTHKQTNIKKKQTYAFSCANNFKKYSEQLQFTKVGSKARNVFLAEENILRLLLLFIIFVVLF